MSVDSKTVQRVAVLARLAVIETDLEQLAGELSRVLELADQLRRVEVTGVEPLAHPHDQALGLRDDQVTETDKREAFMALAPEASGGLYVVPRVIE